MSDKVLIPSEMLEPIVTKTLADMFEWYAIDSKLSYQDLERMISGLSMFIDRTGAKHCQLALGNAQGMIWRFENDPEKLRETFKKVVMSHDYI